MVLPSVSCLRVCHLGYPLRASQRGHIEMRTYRDRVLLPAIGLALLVAAPEVSAADDEPPADAPAFELIEADLITIQAAFDAGRLSAEALTRDYLGRIDALDADGPRLNSLISVNAEALDTARALDVERADKGPRGPLHGIPIVIKDSINAAGLPTTGGSAALRGHEPFHDATVVARLREAGAIVLGKSNLSEMQLPFGRYGYSSAGGQARNPYNLRRTPYSCATAAAVAG